MLIKEILFNKKNCNKIAINYLKEEKTYKQIFECVKKYVTIMQKYSINTNNIGIFLPNSIQYIIAYFSITFLDKVIVPISVQAKKVEIKSTIEYCEIFLIITNNEYKKNLKSYINDLDFKICIFNIDDNSFELIGTNEKFLNKLSVTSREISEDSVAIMLHTSGTTSKPKRVMLTHKNLISNVKSNIESLKLTEDDKVLIALPMFFGYCNTAQLLSHFYIGATIVIMDGIFMPSIFLKLVQKERITNFTGVPSMLLMLLNYRNKLKYDISSLRFICFGGGNMPIEKLRQLIDIFPTVGFIQTYGQTEASPRVTALLPIDAIRKIGSVGKPIPNVIVRIVDEKGQDVTNSECGEIIVHGDNVMKGYYKRPDETEMTIKNGWLYTGDFGFFDNEEYIYLVGRKKNMIISGGLNIYPEEIEELLVCHPKVKEVCVIGESHEMLGEVPIAKIVLKENEDRISEGDIKNYCMDFLANYKVPMRVEFLNELPKTDTGKILRYHKEKE